MRRRWVLWLVGAAVLLAALGVAAVAWLRGTQVAVVEVQRAPLVRTLQFSARVATLSRVDVGSTLTGRVEQVRATGLSHRLRTAIIGGGLGMIFIFVAIRLG